MGYERKTREILDEDVWFHSGDIEHVDDNGKWWRELYHLDGIHHLVQYADVHVTLCSHIFLCIFIWFEKIPINFTNICYTVTYSRSHDQLIVQFVTITGHIKEILIAKGGENVVPVPVRVLVNIT